MPSAQEIILNALIDIRAIGADQNAIPPDYAPICLSKFNRRISSWNAQRQFGQFEYTQVFTLPANPDITPNGYTMGAAADTPALVVTAGRCPIRIDSAKRLLGTGSNTSETEISVLAFDEYNRLTIPGISTNLTIAVYLQTKPKLPILWCYGFASGERLRMSWKALLNTVLLADIATNIDFQDGYEDALTLTLSEDLAIPFGKTISPELRLAAAEARAVVRIANNLPPIAYPDSLNDAATPPNLATFLARDL